jgi:uncharacterized membrane protein
MTDSPISLVHGNVINAFLHLYRADMGVMVAYRTRTDSTTNWCVLLVCARLHDCDVAARQMSWDATLLACAGVGAVLLLLVVGWWLVVVG